MSWTSLPEEVPASGTGNTKLRKHKDLYARIGSKVHLVNDLSNVVIHISYDQIRGNSSGFDKSIEHMPSSFTAA